MSTDYAKQNEIKRKRFIARRRERGSSTGRATARLEAGKKSLDAGGARLCPNATSI